MIFDGKAFAEELISKLPHKKAKLAIFLDPSNVSGAKYVERKVAVAKRLDIEFEIYNLSAKRTYFEINDLISKLNIDPKITGIMLQLPFPNSENLIKLIDPNKDVDGLRENSPFLPAAVLAVHKILNYELRSMNYEPKILIVGVNGFIGRSLRNSLFKIHNSVTGMDKEDFDPEKIKNFDVVISATGSPNLIEDIKEGAVCIDLGFPKGDFAPELSRKASFFTPVPGGVGPVTVACLFENLLSD